MSVTLWVPCAHIPPSGQVAHSGEVEMEPERRNVPSGHAQSAMDEAGDPTRIVSGETQPVHSVEIAAEYMVSGVLRHVAQAIAPPSASENCPASHPVHEDDSGLEAKYPPGQFLHVTTYPKKNKKTKQNKTKQ